MLLTFIILWAYLSFCQLLVTWMGNIKEEAAWYVHRFEGGWKVIGISLILLNFFVPFSLLLVRQNKRKLRFLATIATIVLVMRLVDLYWWVIPASTRDNPHIYISWTYPVALVTIGGLWLAFFIKTLQRRPGDPLAPGSGGRSRPWVNDSRPLLSKAIRATTSTFAALFLFLIAFIVIGIVLHLLMGWLYAHYLRVEASNDPGPASASGQQVAPRRNRGSSRRVTCTSLFPPMTGC